MLSPYTVDRSQKQQLSSDATSRICPCGVPQAVERNSISGYQPSPLAWLHQPANGGLSSESRIYRGQESGSQRRILRAARPAKLELRRGDLLTITNVDGATPLILIPLDSAGFPSPQSVGLQDNPSIPLSEVLHASSSSSLTASLKAFRDEFASQGGVEKLKVTKAVRVFDASTAIGESFVIRVQEPVTLWMLADPITTLSDHVLWHGGMGGALEYQLVRHDAQQNELPEPLAAVRDEFTVSRGTARAYEVRAGETIQIIDVEGRQCSDFMVMRQDALQRHEERYIDSTVTRSMVHGAYPVPGMFDKFYDQDQRPLIKLKQDTVGRHDTFAYACTARGYEERGFFGHLNCSDNISAAYLKYGIKPKSAWPAVNFFFNSWIDCHDNAIQSDEAWSRPGDYVALEAMTDLIAVSTACPDDVDPINGWNPTDVHVRIYKKDQPILHAVAYRSEPDAEPIMTEHSAFHERTGALTRDFVVARDVWLPNSYESSRAQSEYDACRNAVTIQDMSSIRKFDVLGPDAEKLLQLALTRNMTKLGVNRGTYALMCDESGSVIDDGTLFRLTEQAYRWCCGSDDSGLQLKEIAESHSLNVWIKALHSALPNLAIQGPKSRDLLAKLCFTQPSQTDVQQLRWFGSTIARLHDREGEAFQLTRSGYTGELGYEIFCHEKSALAIWDAITEAGQEYNIKPMGLEALNVIRIEAGFMANGSEFGPDSDAYESGLGFAVDLDKDEFIGRSALARNAKDPRRLLVGLKFLGDEVPNHGDPVMVGRRQVGLVTSACLSPELDCAIAMARVSIEHADIGSVVEIGKLDRHGKRLKATICNMPFVDPTRSRARA